MKALIVEDDYKILTYVAKGLKEEGFVVDTADDGADGLYLAQTNEYDIIILDWSLPKYDGIQICQILRMRKNTTPILMLTAKNEIEDKVESLESGSDDYMTKPFSFIELLARVNSLMRRSKYNEQKIIKIDTLEINLIKRLVKRSDRPIELTSKEFDILMCLIENKDSIVSHTKIQEKIWGISEITTSNVVNVFIYHLRKKIDVKGEKPLIKTKKGSGYKIDSYM